MATKVFISWSGQHSQKLGEALRNWLPSALQFVKPYFSPEDIEKGTKWGSEITTELAASDIGVICLTRDNTEKPWILFEAGALSKSLDRSRVCTLLFDIEPTDVKGPLTSFQHTRFVQEDFKRLFVTINNAAGDSRLEVPVLDSVFEMWWPKLEADIATILKSVDKVDKKERRSERDILDELLELTRMNASRPIRSSIARRVMMDLIESLEELRFGLAARGDGLGGIFERMELPLQHLCMEAGAPDLFDRFNQGRHGRPAPFGVLVRKKKILLKPNDPLDRTDDGQ